MLVGLTMKACVTCSCMLVTGLSGNVTMPPENARKPRLSRRLRRETVVRERHLILRMDPISRRVDERGCDKHEQVTHAFIVKPTSTGIAPQVAQSQRVTRSTSGIHRSPSSVSPAKHRRGVVGAGRKWRRQRWVEAAEVQQFQQVTRSAEGGLVASSSWRVTR